MDLIPREYIRLQFLVINNSIVWGNVDEGRYSEMSYWNKLAVLARDMDEAYNQKQRHRTSGGSVYYTRVLYMDVSTERTVSVLAGAFLRL